LKLEWSMWRKHIYHRGARAVEITVSLRQGCMT
jgi:hypothetical protein